MNISVIIPNYNGEKNLQKNIPKVLSSLSEFQGKVEIIICDDDSTDSSVKIINELIEINSQKFEIKIIQNKPNKGFSSNVNSGVKIAKYEILILLNTDVIPSKDFLKPLLKHFSDERVFAVGAMDESVEGSEIVLRGRGLGNWVKGMFVHRAGELDKNSTLWVSGGSGAFRKEVWDGLGGLDNLFDPFYWEDIDLSYRAIKSGYKLIFEKESVVRHEHEEGAIKSKFKSSEVKKISYRNQFIFIWKNADFGTLIFHLFYLPYHLVVAIKSKNKELIHGLILALILIPKIINRRINKKIKFKLSDSQAVNL